MNCPNKARNLEFCNCSYSGCDKTGVCCECVQYHRKKGQIPACFFSTDEEKTFDRSISNFIKSREEI